MKVLSGEQLEKSINLLASMDGAVFQYIATEFEPMSKSEKAAFKFGFYAGIDLTTELLRKLNSGELKEKVERGME